MIDFESWWNSYAADDFRAANPDLDGRAVRPVWDAALTAAIAHYGKAMDAMLAAAPQPTAEQSSEHVPGLAGLIAAKTAEIEPLIPWQIRTAEQVEEYKDARRYRRLQILGAAPYGSQNLSKGTVLSFQALDAFVDSDLEAYPSRGESKAAQSPVAVLQDAPGLDSVLAKQNAFERWAESHGGLILDRTNPAERGDHALWPCTYRQYETEIAWRAVANTPAGQVYGAPGLDDHAEFEDAMVAAGYRVPERGDAFATQYLFQRDQDRFEGFQMGRAALQVKANAAPAHEHVAPSEVMNIWDIFSNGKWWACMVSPLGWDAQTVKEEIVRQGYSSNLMVAARKVICADDNPVAALMKRNSELEALLSQRQDDTELLRDIRKIADADFGRGKWTPECESAARRIRARLGEQQP